MPLIQMRQLLNICYTTLIKIDHRVVTTINFIANTITKNVSRIRKKTFYLQFCMGTPEGHQKSIYVIPQK
jgi:hypothetical protein